ncbi:MAG: sulfurtransferase TusA family protein [Leptolyngbya sp. SIO1D8]|nr:sulfurtransferase TusA family protein [Leptolyngbya sp. SIO1D8]
MPIEPDIVMDLRGTPCPINFVRTKLQLQRMEVGKLLEVWIDLGEPVQQVPDSLRMEGYGIEQLIDQDTYCALQVRNLMS